MQTWEYRTFYLHYLNLKSWKVMMVDDIEQPDWKKREGDSSLALFCTRQSKEGWELVTASQSGVDGYYTLFFKRPSS